MNKALSFYRSIVAALGFACFLNAIELRNIQADENPTNLKPAALWLTQPDELYFSDDFSSAENTERWAFNQNWSVQNAVLVRGDGGKESTRIFLKKPRYSDCVIRFNFKFTGAKDIRLVTGGGGHYNSVVHIRRDHFYIQTALDKSVPWFSMRHGECAFDFETDRWYSMTVEFIGDELVAHVDDQHMAYARHPIIKSTREYLAFQVDESMAEFDNVDIRTTKPHRNQDQQRAIVRSRIGKHPVTKSREENLAIAKKNAHARLHLNDEKFRKLVQRVDELDAKNKRAFPAVFMTHKEFQKTLQAERKRLNAEDPHYKKLLVTSHRANRAIEQFLVEQKPEIEDWPDSRRKRELGVLARKLKDDSQFQQLTAAHETAVKNLETEYARVFVTNEQFTKLRHAERKKVEKTDAFRQHNQTRAAAYRAQQDYLIHDAKYGELLREN